MDILARSVIDAVSPRGPTGPSLRLAAAHRPPLPVPRAAEARPTRQMTLLREVRLAGRGLHTGRAAVVRLVPAPEGHGIVFRRIMPGGTLDVRADWTRRVSRPLCTSLSLDGTRIVRTVEHLLAALSALAIDNVLVEIEGEELPIFDGSAVHWCRAIGSAGRRDAAAVRRYLRVRRSVRIEDGRRSVTFEPSNSLSLDVGIALRHFGAMRWRGQVTPAVFTAEIAPSRSFGRLKWALPAKLYSLCSGRALLRGAHPGTCAVIWGGRVLGGMRVPDEPVRHRALDLIGDLALAGFPILAHVTARDPGHEINHAALARLMRDHDAWEIV